MRSSCTNKGVNAINHNMTKDCQDEEENIDYSNSHHMHHTYHRHHKRHHKRHHRHHNKHYHNYPHNSHQQQPVPFYDTTPIFFLRFAPEIQGLSDRRHKDQIDTAEIVSGGHVRMVG